MTYPLSERTEEFARSLAPESDDVIEAMDARADDEGFPTVGPAVGGWLRLLARSVDAERIFEFGSGYGYSAYWMATTLPQNGKIVLTEIDQDELADARENLERGGFADLASFEHGDAIEIAKKYSGPFDLVLIDNEKHRYVEAFDTIREKVPVGGVVVADNAMNAGSINFDDVSALLAGNETEANEGSRGIASYLCRIREDESFETGLLPLGDGVAVSIRYS